MDVADPATAQLPGLVSTQTPPDVVILVTAFTSLLLLEILHRRKIGRLFRTYVNLPFRDRLDWDRRTLNVFFQLFQFLFNAYLLLADPNVIADSLYGYSTVAHVGFLVIIAFYVHDTMSMIIHPRPPSNTPWWILHHLVAIGLLRFATYRRTSAFPAATFLISAVGHIPNDLRWLVTAMNLNDRRIINATNVVSAVVVFLSCILPPPFLLRASAKQLDLSVLQLITTKMRPYCVFFYSLIYFPHIGLTIHQFVRVYTRWNKLPGPFRPSRVD